MAKVLFLLRHRLVKSTALHNTASFDAAMLRANGHDAKVQEINWHGEGPAGPALHQMESLKPSHVIIEAPFINPKAVRHLADKYPATTFVIRMHSELPFFVNECSPYIAMDWVAEYTHHPRVRVAFNSERMYKDMVKIFPEGLMYLPFDYSAGPAQLALFEKDTTTEPAQRGFDDPKYDDIGCFGALRPLKNQLTQAVAAIQFARERGKKLRFHINGARVECGGDPILPTLESLFLSQRPARDLELVKHGWLTHPTFMDLASEMTVGLQVSLSESFNIVAADLVMARCPIVVSPEVKWAAPESQAYPTHVEDIVAKMHLAMAKPELADQNLFNLRMYSQDCWQIWERFLEETDAENHKRTARGLVGVGGQTPELTPA